MLLKQMNEENKPRMKLKRLGPSSLTDTELLALIIGKGTKEDDVLKVADNLMELIDDISNLTDLTIEELTKIKGIGVVKSINILACVELAKRINLSKQRTLSFTTPEAIYEYFKPRFVNVLQEHLYVIFIDYKGKVIAIKHLTKGTQKETLFDPVLVFKYAVKYSASSLILVHNHPSGDPFPSLPDLKATIDLAKQATVIGLKVLDHIIVGDGFISFRRSVDSFKKLKL